MGGDHGTEPPVGGWVRSDKVLVSRSLTPRLLTNRTSAGSGLAARAPRNDHGPRLKTGRWQPGLTACMLTDVAETAVAWIAVTFPEAIETRNVMALPVRPLSCVETGVNGVRQRGFWGHETAGIEIRDIRVRPMGRVGAGAGEDQAWST